MKRSEAHLQSRFKKISNILGSTVAILGLAMLIGWWLNARWLLSPFLDHGPMNPLTAILFAAMGLSIIVSNHNKAPQTKLLLYSLLSAIALFSGTEMLELFIAYDFPFDSWLFAEKITTYENGVAVHQVLMSANTATCFFLITVASVLINTNRTSLQRLGGYLVALVGMVSTLCMLGHLYNLQPLAGLISYRVMSLYTSILFFLLSIGLSLKTGPVGFLSAFFSHRSGGYTARLFILIFLSMLIVTGFARSYLERHSLIEPTEGISIVITINLVAFFVMLYILAKKVNVEEAEHDQAEEETRKAADTYNVILESSMAGYWDWDICSDRIYLSPAFREMVGFGEETTTAQLIREVLIYPEDFPKVEEAIRAHVDSKGSIPLRTEIRCRHKNGSLVWVLSRGKVIEWTAEGKPARMVGSHVNISAIKEAQEKLVESESLFTSLFFNSPVTLAITKASNGVLLDTNEAFSDLFGYTREEVIGKTTLELGLFADPAVRGEILEGINKSGSVHNKEILYRIKSGELKYTSYSAFLFKLSGEECLLSAIVDIDELKKTQKRLNESEQLFSTLFYKSPVMLTLYDDATGQIRDVNEKTESFLGVGRKDLVGKTDTDRSVFSNLSDSRHITELLTKSRSVRNFEFAAVNGHGEPRMISCDIDRLVIGGKELLLVSGIDITATKAYEEQIEALNKSLEQRIVERTREITDYKIALDESAIVAVTDPRGVIMHVNDNFCRISKFERSEIIGQTHSLVNSGFHSEEFFRDLWKTISSGKIWQGEIKNKAKDGSYYWVNTSIVPFLDKNNRPYQYLAIRFDVTAKKEAEALLLRSEIDLRSILENSDTAYILFDSEYRIKSFNSLAFAFTKKHLGKDLEVHAYSIDYFPGERKKMMLQMMDKAMQGLSPAYEICYPNQGGNDDWYYTRFSGIRSQNGKPEGLIMQISNISEQKRLQKQREKITFDLVRQNQDLERFSYIVSHNLRSPVSTIMGLTSLIKELDPTDKDFSVVTSGLETSANNLDMVVRDLNHILELKRDINDKKEKVDLVHLTQDIVADLHSTITKQFADITTHFEEKEIWAYKGHLYNVFQNLISNSLKYHRPNVHPVVKISSVVAEGKFVISFEDNGRGVDTAKYQNQLFGLYKRFHRDVEGKGMGLFMTKTQVEAMGGKISISSKVGKGTRFDIEFEAANVSVNSPTPLPVEV